MHATGAPDELELELEVEDELLELEVEDELLDVDELPLLLLELDDDPVPLPLSPPQAARTTVNAAARLLRPARRHCSLNEFFIIV